MADLDDSFLADLFDDPVTPSAAPPCTIDDLEAQLRAAKRKARELSAQVEGLTAVLSMRTA
jgi:hypothetical protein